LAPTWKPMLASPALRSTGTLHWPPGDHNANPYSYNREFIYKWVSASDGGWDVKRIRPDPVYDCAGGNIPAEAKTVCNS